MQIFRRSVFNDLFGSFNDLFRFRDFCGLDVDSLGKDRIWISIPPSAVARRMQ